MKPFSAASLPVPPGRPRLLASETWARGSDNTPMPPHLRLQAYQPRHRRQRRRRRHPPKAPTTPTLKRHSVAVASPRGMVGRARVVPQGPFLFVILSGVWRTRASNAVEELSSEAEGTCGCFLLSFPKESAVAFLLVIPQQSGGICFPCLSLSHSERELRRAQLAVRKRTIYF